METPLWRLYKEIQSGIDEGPNGTSRLMPEIDFLGLIKKHMSYETEFIGRIEHFKQVADPDLSEQMSLIKKLIPDFCDREYIITEICNYAKIYHQKQLNDSKDD